MTLSYRNLRGICYKTCFPIRCALLFLFLNVIGRPTLVSAALPIYAAIDLKLPSIPCGTAIAWPIHLTEDGLILATSFYGGNGGFCDDDNLYVLRIDQAGLINTERLLVPPDGFIYPGTSWRGAYKRSVNDSLDVLMQCGNTYCLWNARSGELISSPIESWRTADLTSGRTVLAGNAFTYQLDSGARANIFNEWQCTEVDICLTGAASNNNLAHINDAGIVAGEFDYLLYESHVATVIGECSFSGDNFGLCPTDNLFCNGMEYCVCLWPGGCPYGYSYNPCTRCQLGFDDPPDAETCMCEDPCLPDDPTCEPWPPCAPEQCRPCDTCQAGSCIRFPPPCPSEICDEAKDECSAFRVFVGIPGEVHALAPHTGATEIASIVDFADAGYILARAWMFGDSQNTDPIVWTGSSWRELDTTGYDSVSLYDINDVGQVVGSGYPTGSLFNVALLWDEAGEPHNLNAFVQPTPVGPTQQLTEALRINNLGHILCSRGNTLPVLLRPGTTTTLDLSIHSVEWGQTLFKKANGQPYLLVSGKPFFVRIFPDRNESAPPGEWNAALHLHFMDRVVTHLSLNGPLGPGNIRPIGVDGPRRTEENGSFNFLIDLPSEEEGSLLKIVAEINPNNMPSETNRQNNTRDITRDELAFVETIQPTVVHVPVNLGYGSLTPDDSIMMRYNEVFPVANAMTPLLLGELDCRDCLVESDNHCCYKKVNRRVASLFGGQPFLRAVGWYLPPPNEPCSGGGTLGNVSLINTIGQDKRAQSLAHELGHSFICHGHNGSEFASGGACASDACAPDPHVGFIQDPLDVLNPLNLNIGVSVYANAPPYTRYYSQEGSWLLSLMAGMQVPVQGHVCSANHAGGCAGRNDGDLSHWIKRTEYEKLSEVLTTPIMRESALNESSTLLLSGTWDQEDNSIRLDHLIPSPEESLGPFSPNDELSVRLYTLLEQTPVFERGLAVNRIRSEVPLPGQDTKASFIVGQRDK